MAIAVTLTISPAAPAHGATVTATYNVTGNSSGAGTPVSVSATATIGGKAYPITAEFTMPGAPVAAETFAVPTAAGLTFKATSAANVFTAVVP